MKKGPKVVIGVVEKEGEVLMIRRAIKKCDLLWSFPGGKMDPEDASEEYAIKREVKEETGIECSPVSILGSRTHPDTGKVISYWRCKYVSGEPQIQDPEEIVEVSWVSPPKVFKIVTTDIFPPIRAMLKEISSQ